jgi:CheY-like chemotaxis protein
LVRQAVTTEDERSVVEISAFWSEAGGAAVVAVRRITGGNVLSLVVDDDRAIRSYIQAILHAENFETVEAGDGAQALTILRKLEGHVDLIISDIQMPVVDGISFARAVRASYPCVPVILVSGRIDPNVEFEFVEKPFSRAIMVSAIHRVARRAA